MVWLSMQVRTNLLVSSVDLKSRGAGIFIKLQDIAHSSGIRVVGVNRRDYGGSSPFTTEDMDTIINGATSARDLLVKSMGIELLNYIDIFIQQHDIPVISSDGNSGGIALVGWSLGTILTVPAIANIDAIAADARSRISSRLRAYIMHGM
jgi:pimeloyl-ACP methyl ester carboxylesterase